MNKFMSAKNGKKYLIIFLLIFNFLAHANLAYAQTYSGVDKEITKYLCTPTINSSNPLFACINQIYKFTLAICSVIAVFFIVLAGFRYMSAEGSQETVDKAKDMLVTSIAGLVILFAGYILLKTLNPDLVQFKSIQLPATPAPTPLPTVPGITPSDTTQQLASQILNNPKIILATSHVSEISDSATAQQNIQNTASGKPASLSNYQNAPGGTVALNSTMLSALISISQTYSIGVSEIAGGSHTGESSKHYLGTAFDINNVNDSRLTPGNQYITPLMNLCKQFGATEVIDESSTSNHVHCGW